MQNVVQNLIENGEVDKLSTIFADGSFIRYLDANRISDLFRLKPELFFDGVIFHEAYNTIEGVAPEIKYDLQKKLCRKYGNYLDSLVDFLDSKNMIKEEIDRSKLAFEIIKEKVVKDVY